MFYATTGFDSLHFYEPTVLWLKLEHYRHGRDHASLGLSHTDFVNITHTTCWWDKVEFITYTVRETTTSQSFDSVLEEEKQGQNLLR